MSKSIEELLLEVNSGKSYTYVSLASGGVGFAMVAPGILDSVILSGASITFKLWDHASGASGVTIANLTSPAVGGQMMLDAKILNGLTIEVTAAPVGAGFTTIYR